ncbi:MAG TPA: DNA polymerase III subunit beta [Planctomycetota bacterium]|nr:DNA polymerase III subunit beta [Planctomycetota bacterium]
MKLTCDRLELSEALGLAATVVPARSPRPVLQNVCIRARKDGVEVLATDLEVSIRAKITRVDVDREGDALIPAARAVAIVRELQGDKVEIASEDRIATISAEGSKFKVVGEDPGEFPQIPTFDVSEKDAIKFGRTQLEAMIRKTVFAAASEGARYALNGVLFDLKENRLRLVATDGKRLALCERPVELAADSAAVHCVVPTKGVQHLAKLAGPDDETVSLRFSDRQVLAASSRATLSAQLVQGHFPPYDGVIPKGHPRKVEFEAGAFLAALRRASVLTTEDSKGVKLTFGFNKLVLSSRTPEVGESTIDLPVPYADDPLEVSFDPKYLIDAMKVLDSDRFALELKDDTSPGVLHEGESFTYVVMPISLG